MTSEQFFFCCYNRSADFFSGHMPCKFFFVVMFFRKGRGRVKIRSICVSP